MSVCVLRRGGSERTIVPQNRHLLFQHISIRGYMCASIHYAFEHPDTAAKHLGLRGVQNVAKQRQSIMDRLHQLPFVRCAVGYASRVGAGRQEDVADDEVQGFVRGAAARSAGHVI